MGYYLLLFICIWFGTGFLVGLKNIYIDKDLSPENMKKIKDKLYAQGYRDDVVETVAKKSTYMMASTLLGFRAVYLDIKQGFIEYKIKKAEQRKD